MSYSFRVAAATKAEAEQLLREQLDAIVISQPAHKADAEQAFAAAQSFLALLADDPPRAAVPAVLETEDAPGVAEIQAYGGRDVTVSMNGSIYSVDNGASVQGASVNISVGYGAPKPV